MRTSVAAAACLAAASVVQVVYGQSMPAPLSITPNQNWDGDDGPWNSFTISVGTPPQYVRVFVATASQQTWVIPPQGCNGATGEAASSCHDLRGWDFNSTESSTWDDIGTFLLHIEQNLGYWGNADYGWETVTLGGNGDNGPTIHNSTVGVTAGLDFLLGIFGVHPKPTNFTGFGDPQPSYMTLLKQTQQIPSLSFGYTAGAQYIGTGQLAHLTLGGYDQSLYEPNNLTWTLASDNERDIVVGLQGISLAPNGTNAMTEGIFMYIDSTIGQIWLPVEVCQAFEREYNLTYDSTSELYLLNSTQHQNLLDLNPNITFTLGYGESGGETVDITLPYAAFDKNAIPPFQNLTQSYYYFPIRRAMQPNTYVFGRTFLQETYLSVDWERAKFNVSQNIWDRGAEDIVTIQPRSDAERNEQNGSGSGSGSSKLSAGAIAGIVVGVVAGLALLAAAVTFWLRRRRHKQLEKQRESEKVDEARRSDSSSGATLQAPGVVPKAELDAGSDAPSPSTYAKYEPSHADSGTLRPASSTAATTSPLGTLLMGSPPASPRSPIRTVGGLQEVENSEREVYEMPGDLPAPVEMPEHGQLGPTAKERDIAREREYNGINPSEQQPPRVT